MKVICRPGVEILVPEGSGAVWLRFGAKLCLHSDMLRPYIIPETSMEPTDSILRGTVTFGRVPPWVPA